MRCVLQRGAHELRGLATVSAAPRAGTVRSRHPGETCALQGEERVDDPGDRFTAHGQIEWRADSSATRGERSVDINERLSLDAAARYTSQACEHIHRYEIAAVLCEGLRVLDLACGSGYGSAILAERARS